MAADIIITGDFSNVVQGAKQAGDELRNMGQDAKQAGDSVKKGFNEVNQSLGEMKRELRSLRNESFMGKTEAEIKAVRARMAELTDKIGDFQAQVRTASADRIPALINGLQGIVAVTQGVTATLGLFGVENEKLEKSMIQLIGASQALSTIYDLYEKQTFKVAVATAKDTVATISNTVAKKANALAAGASTKAMKLLYTTIAANPLGALAVAIGTVVTAIIAMQEETTGADKAIKDFSDSMGEMVKNSVKETEAIKKSIANITDQNKSQLERSRLVDEMMKKYPGYLNNMDREALIAGNGAEAYTKMANAIRRKAIIQSLEEKNVTVLQQISELTIKRVALENELAKVSALNVNKQNDYKFAIQDVTNQINELNSQYRVNQGVIEKQTEQLPQTAAAASTLSGGLKNINKELKGNIKYTKEDTKEVKENYDILAKYNKLVADIGESFKGMESSRVTPEAPLPQIEEEDNSALISEMEARYAIQKDFYKNLELLLRTHQITQEEYDDAILAKRIDNLNKYVEAVSRALNNVDDITSNLQEMEMNKFKASQDEQTAKLEEEYEKRYAAAGSNVYKQNQLDKWYSGEKERLEQETTAKSLEIEKKYRNTQKALAITQAIISGAQGILGAWVQASMSYPPPISAIVAGVQSALIAGVTATQIGVISSQKYAKGGTGVIDGKSHVSGGVPFFGGEAESDERWAIFNREATLRNTGLSDLIDAVNGHQLIIDNDFMKRLKGDGTNNIIVMSNFKGSEHLAGMHEIMRRNEGRDILLPDGRIKRGIIKRRYN